MNTKQKKIDLMKRWIAALRSGEYKQGRGQLVDNGKYCCLGVLCDISKKQFKLKIHSDYVEANKLNFTGLLPDNLEYYLGLNKDIDSNGNIRSFSDYLVELNDRKNSQFKTIANYIEKNILPLLERE